MIDSFNNSTSPSQMTLFLSLHSILGYSGGIENQKLS